MTDTSEHGVRLAELIAALSLATDLGMGQPMEQALRTCLLSVEIGRELGVDGEALSDVYYLALLRFVGCTSDAHEQASLAGGDEIAHRAGLATVLMGEPPEFLRFMMRDFARGAPRFKRVGLFAGAMASGRSGAKTSIALHCEVAQILAARMGLRPSVARDVRHVFERWDGRGLPGELSEHAIPLAARIVAVARDVDVFFRLGGWPLATHVLRRRRSRAYDPSIVEVLLTCGERWAADMETRSVWQAALEAEPQPWGAVREQSLDDVLRAFAEFADLKCPFTVGHSLGVARLAEEAARGAGLGESDVADIRRAGLVHDLGRSGVPNGILDKPGALTQIEWERVRLHPYLSERILAHAGALRQIAVVAGSHHERLDGSGYHRQVAAPALSFPARVLAAADAYQAMTQERPYRPALAANAAAEELSLEAEGGRLDAEAVRAVLAAAGHHRPRQPSWPAGLTDREVEVLRLIAQGLSYRQVADRLTITPKTAEHHIEHIYNKIGVSARASAALFAMEHDLISL